MGRRKKGNSNIQFFTSCISTTFVLILLGTVVFFVLTAQRLSDSVRENFKITVLLSDEVPLPESSHFQSSLRTERFINELFYISKEQALKEQIVELGSDPSEFLGSNPFSASVELQLKSEYTNTDSLQCIAKQLKENPIVTDVIYQKDLIKNLNNNLQKVSLVLLILAGLFAFVSFGLINNTIRLIVYSRRFLIHTMKLVGAPWNFIRRPFIVRSIWIGVIAATIANTFLVGGIHFLMQYDRLLEELITLNMICITVGSVFLSGVLITLLCSYYSVNSFLKMKAGELYEI